MNQIIEFTKDNNPMYFVCPCCENRIEEDDLKVIISSNNNLNSYVDLSVKCNICGHYMNKTKSTILAQALENFANKGYVIESASEGFIEFAMYEFMNFPMIYMNGRERYLIDPNTKEGKFKELDHSYLETAISRIDSNKNIDIEYDHDTKSYSFTMNIDNYPYHPCTIEDKIKYRDNFLKTMLKFSEEL